MSALKFISKYSCKLSYFFPIYSQSTFYKCLKLFNRKTKLRIFLVSLAQVVNSFFDLLGVLLMGLIGGLLIYQNSSIDYNSRIFKITEFIGISDLSFRQQMLVLGFLTLIFLTIKSVLSILITSKIMNFYFAISANLASKIIQKMFALPITKLNDYSLQNSNYISTNGASTLSILLSSYSNLVSDVFLCFILLVGLAFTDFTMTIIISLFFGGTISILYLYFRNKSTHYGIVRAQTNIRASELFYEAFQGFKEIVVAGRIGNYLNFIKEKLLQSAKNEARIAFVPFVNKFVLEILLVYSIFIMGFIQFLTESTAHAITVLTIFMAASTRIVPALLRIQQSFISIRNSKGTAIDTFKFIELLSNIEEKHIDKVEFEDTRAGFIPSVKISKLSFKYEGTTEFRIDIDDLIINPNDTIAIVGKSGAGKSTLIDLLLGLNKPDSGFISISDNSPRDTFKLWPGAVAYVPQNSHIINGTFLDNLCMGLSAKDISLAAINKVLKKTQLFDFVESLPLGISTWVGERGTKLSGGQKQRLSIARALLTNPGLIVLDEATSALDTETEKTLIDFFEEVRGQLTLIIIAHRLSTVKSVPRILYMENGKIVSSGDFEFLRKNNQNFEKQAALSGY